MTDIELRLVAYVDGELDPDGIAEVERLIAVDAGARRSVAIYRDTAALLRAACAEGGYAGGRVAPAPPRPRLARWRRPLAVAAAVAMLLVGFGGGRFSVSHPADASFIDDVAEYHAIYSRETAHLVEVPAERSGEIATWLGGLLQRPVVAPDLTAAGLTFAGARLWISDGNPVADLLYTRAVGLPVALCIVHAESRDGVAAPADGIEQTLRGDLRVAVWRHAGYTFAVVGDLTAAAAREIALEARHVGDT